MGKTKNAPDVVKAEWTTQYINGLPNSSFAVVEPAYHESCENESGECTEDKNARHLPHHAENGDIDVNHLRNALSRANQIKPITNSISKEELVKKAEAHLDKHKGALDGKSIDALMDDSVWHDFCAKYASLTLDNWRKYMEKKETPAVETEVEPAAEPVHPPEKKVEKDEHEEAALSEKMDKVMSKMDELMQKMDGMMAELSQKPDETKVVEPETNKPAEPAKEPVSATEVKEALAQDLPAEKTLQAFEKLTQLIEAYGKKQDGLKDTIMAEVKQYIEELRVPAPGKAALKTEPAKTHEEETPVRKSAKETEAELRQKIEDMLSGLKN